MCMCQMSQSFLGKQIDGVWHTGVVVFGKEFFFGGGIQDDVPGRTPYGVPVQRIPLGDSHIPHEVFVEFLQEISSRFSMESCKCLALCVLHLCIMSMYRASVWANESTACMADDLLHNNCNNFSNECSIFLTGAPIPEYIMSLPSEVLNTPLGKPVCVCVCVCECVCVCMCVCER